MKQDNTEAVVKTSEEIENEKPKFNAKSNRLEFLFGIALLAAAFATPFVSYYGFGTTFAAAVAVTAIVSALVFACTFWMHYDWNEDAGHKDEDSQKDYTGRLLVGTLVTGNVAAVIAWLSLGLSIGFQPLGNWWFFVIGIVVFVLLACAILWVRLESLRKATKKWRSALEEAQGRESEAERQAQASRDGASRKEKLEKRQQASSQLTTALNLEASWFGEDGSLTQKGERIEKWIPRQLTRLADEIQLHEEQRPDVPDADEVLDATWEKRLAELTSRFALVVANLELVGFGRFSAEWKNHTTPKPKDAETNKAAGQ